MSKGELAILMSGTSWNESHTRVESRTWGQARQCRLRDTGYQSRTCSVPMSGADQGLSQARQCRTCAALMGGVPRDEVTHVGAQLLLRI